MIENNMKIRLTDGNPLILRSAHHEWNKMISAVIWLNHMGVVSVPLIISNYINFNRAFHLNILDLHSWYSYLVYICMMCISPVSIKFKIGYEPQIRMPDTYVWKTYLHEIALFLTTTLITQSCEIIIYVLYIRIISMAFAVSCVRFHIPKNYMNIHYIRISTIYKI